MWEAFTTSANQAGLEAFEVYDTLRSALQTGTSTPRDLPDIMVNGKTGSASQTRAMHCPTTERNEDCKDRISAAQGIWDTAGPLEGPGVGYLMGRGVTSAETAPARLLRASDGISIVFPLHDAKGKLVAVQMVKIDDNGQAILRKDGRKDKRSRGSVRDGLFYAHRGGDDRCALCRGSHAVEIHPALDPLDDLVEPALQLGSLLGFVSLRRPDAIVEARAFDQPQDTEV